MTAHIIRGRLPMLIAAITVLALAMALLFSPVQAQQGSAPAKPTGLTATATHDQVVLTWDGPGDDSITGYMILRRVRENDVGGKFSELVPDTGSAATGYTDDTVVAGTTYTYRIKAINEHGVSERSRWFHIDIPAAPEPEEQEQDAERPGKPTGLTATATHDQVVLTWDGPGDDSITGYMILRRVRVNNTGGEFSELVADTGTAATTYIDDTVVAGTTYTYRIKAINEHGVSERSRWFHIDTLAAPEPEADPADLVPSGLTAVLTDGQVVLSWDAPVEDAGSVTGYEILRGQGEGDPATLAADTDSAATAYTDFSAGGTSESYAYRVRAIRGVEKSADSNEARVQLPPAAPKRVVSAASSDLVLLSWADPQDDSVTGYRILRRLWAGDEPDDFRTLAEDTGSADTAYADDTVENGRVYVYRVLAINPGGVSEPSQDVRVRTTTPVASLTGARANVSEPDGEDFENDEGTPGEVDVNGSVTGNIDSGSDQDYFRVYLVSGQRYRFNLQGSDGGGGTLSDPVLTLVRMDLTYLTSNDNTATLDSQIFYTATTTGDHYLCADGKDATITGTYTLSVREIDGVVDVGGTVTGTIETDDDRDSFTVELEADTAYEIAVKGFFTDFVPGIFNQPSRTPNYSYSSARYSLHSPVVTVRDGYGDWLATVRYSTVISSTDPCRPLYFEGWDPVMEFTPDEAGTYIVEVWSLGSGNYYRRGAPDSNRRCTSLNIQYDATGTYEVSVREWPPHISKPVGQSSAPSYWYWNPGRPGVASEEPIPAHEAFTGEAGAEGETHTPDTYGRGEAIEFTVTFTEDVQVTGTPELHLRASTTPRPTAPRSGDRWARYDRGTGTQELVFAYTVQSGDYGEVGFSTGAWLQGGKRLVFRLSGGAAITSVATGSHAVLDSYQGVASNAKHRVNGRVVTPAP